MYHDKGEASEGWITDIDDYVDDANIFLITPLHLHLLAINQEDNQDAPKDKPKTNLPGFISNPFILFWSIYYSSYANNNKNNNIMEQILDYTQLVNINFTLKGHYLDAAVDINWQLHAYNAYLSKDFQDNHVAIEVYNFNHPEWDVLMIYQEYKRKIIETPFTHIKYVHSCLINFDNILEETKKWIEGHEENYQ